MSSPPFTTSSKNKFFDKAPKQLLTYKSSWKPMKSTKINTAKTPFTSTSNKLESSPKVKKRKNHPSQAQLPRGKINHLLKGKLQKSNTKFKEKDSANKNTTKISSRNKILPSFSPTNESTENYFPVWTPRTSKSWSAKTAPRIPPKKVNPKTDTHCRPFQKHVR
jgi:hypothetical protein